MGSRPVLPSPILERTIRAIPKIFQSAGVPYWLSFGALWGIVKADGAVPDGDLDICTYYEGQDFKRLRKIFEQHGYALRKAMLDDACRDNVVYAGFDHPQMLHVCVSFWYPYKDRLFYCHDTNNEIPTGMGGVPPSGYYFKGCPAKDLRNPVMFRDVEWPGIDQMYKIRVPRFPDAMAFRWMYPDWAYQIQRFNIDPARREVDHQRMMSYHRGMAVSPYQVHVKSMSEWMNQPKIDKMLEQSEAEWNERLRKSQKVVPIK